MITYDEVLNMNYYKKTTFTGWTGKMRFRIGKHEEENTEPVLRVYAWPAPYNYETTPAESKICADFPFSEEGRKQAVDWLNDQATHNPLLAE